jgi:hypothetical protein
VSSVDLVVIKNPPKILGGFFTGHNKFVLQNTLSLGCKNMKNIAQTIIRMLARTLLSRALLGGLALLGVLALPGCATYSAGFNQVEKSAANRDLDSAIKSLDALNLSGVDQALHNLNKGTLLRMQGRFAESNDQFDAAKSLMEKLNAISVTEQAASVSVSDTMKAYEGLPNEQLMVYAFEALNYLQMGDADGAAVEARQFDVKQGLIAAKNKGVKYLSGAFVRYLNGMVYEAVGESDSARIEMQKALEGYKLQNASFPVPRALKDDLSRLNAGKPAASEVTFVLHNGLGPSVDENNIRVANPAPGPNGPAMFSLAVPRYSKRSVPVARVELRAGARTATSEVVEDINEIAEKSFNDRLPLIIARGVARLVVKNVASQEAKKKMEGNPYGALLKLGADIAVNASERADTRSWSLIPGNILMARLPLPAGSYDLSATYYDANGRILGTREFKEVQVKKGKKSFVSDYYLNPPAAPKAAN